MKKLLLSCIVMASFSVQAQFWTQKSTGFATVSRGINDISIVDQNVVWAKAYDGSAGAVQTVKEVTKSVDGGNTWTPITINLGLATSGLGLGSITAISADVAWVTAYPAAAGTTNIGGVWKTVNGGTNWTKQVSAAYTAASFTNIVHFFDANNGMTMGDPTDGYFEIYTTPDGGTTWTRVPTGNIPLPLTGEYGYVGNVDAVGSTVWFGTNLGRIYKSADMGMNWTVSQSPLSDFGSATVSGNYSFSDINKGILNSAAGQLWNTTDGGVTWTPMSPTGTFGNNDIEYVPGTSKIVSSGGATGYGSYYSLNDGMTWMEAEATTQFTDVEFLDSTTGFAGGFNTSSTVGGIYKYTGTQLPVAQFNQQVMTVYPNPSNGIMQITGISVKDVLVHDILGKQVYHNSFNNLDSAIDLDLSSLHSGIYMMTVTNDAGLSKTVKIVKN